MISGSVWPRAARASSVAEATSSRLASKTGLSFSARAIQSLKVNARELELTLALPALRHWGGQKESC